jgi:beta-glucosidase
MAKITGILRGVGAVAALGLALSMAAEPIMETYAAPLDTFFGTVSSSVVSEKTDAADWIYQSEFKTIKETYEGMKAFAIEEAQESMTLLKNKANALPISKTEKITLMGIRAYVPVYGNDMGAAVDTNAVETGTQITNVFAERGFQINPTMMQTYKDWVVAQGGKLMENGDFYAKYSGGGGSGGADTGSLNLQTTDAVVEASPAELAALNANYNASSNEYGTAIVVVGRAGGESKNYVPGGTDSKTGNIFGLSAEERAVIEDAKANYDKVIVLVNSTNQLELAELEADDGIDAIMWIGYPGAFGFYGVADVLNGTVAPSGHLGDIYAANGSVNPSMENFGNIPWANKSDFASGENVNGYLINA